MSGDKCICEPYNDGKIFNPECSVAHTHKPLSGKISQQKFFGKFAIKTMPHNEWKRLHRGHERKRFNTSDVTAGIDCFVAGDQCLDCGQIYIRQQKFTRSKAQSELSK